jgi:predicted nucleic acid-binding protein
MMSSKNVVVDASFALSLVLDSPFSQEIQDLWTGWLQRDLEIAAPQLWLYEITSAIHKIHMLQKVSVASALAALEAVISLEVHIVVADPEQCRSAFAWASRLNQTATYDGFYLALAEKLDAEFWTVDQRLASAAHRLRVEWVRLVGERNLR